MQELLTTAESIAREAGALLRDFYHRGVRTEYKGDVDLVTEADRASEALITTRLRSAFPGHGIYGEEGTRQALDSEFPLRRRCRGLETQRGGACRSALRWPCRPR